MERSRQGRICLKPATVERSVSVKVFAEVLSQTPSSLAGPGVKADPSEPHWTSFGPETMTEIGTVWSKTP